MFLEGPVPPSTDIPLAALETMRRVGQCAACDPYGFRQCVACDPYGFVARLA